MTTQIITISSKWLVDVEGAYIPYSGESLTVNHKEDIKHSSIPFSEIKTGKFRKLFDRHIFAYKH